MKKTFVTENIEVYRNETAENLLNKINDKEFFEEGIGVRKVSKARWETAQRYERKTWCVQCTGLSTDRNETHMDFYNNYKDLQKLLPPSISIAELGCGPFTNLRLILPRLNKKITRIDLLDPLITDYQLHMPKCAFRTGMINFNKVNLINSSIECWEPAQQYDLVVVINVLEHTQCIETVWTKILSVLNTGGILVFADKFVKNELLEEKIKNSYDAGHAIFLSDSYMMEKINKDFIIHYQNEISEEETSITKYFILKKK